MEPMPQTHIKPACLVIPLVLPVKEDQAMIV